MCEFVLERFKQINVWEQSFDTSILLFLQGWAQALDIPADSPGVILCSSPYVCIVPIHSNMEGFCQQRVLLISEDWKGDKDRGDGRI